jgi:hypothetical protein
VPAPLPFLTLEDPNAKIKGSRDPLGVQPVWSRFARHFVTNLTNTTNSVRNFSVLLLGRYFGERLLDARRIEQDDLLPVFLRVEQACAYVRHVAHGVQGDIRGIERVQRFLEEEKHRPRIEIDAGSTILSDQKVYGLWGLFSVSARVSGLIADGPAGLTPRGRDFVERAYVPLLEPGMKRLLDLFQRGGRLNTKKHDSAFEALALALPEEFTSDERSFYAHHFRDAAEVKDAAPGRQALFSQLLREHTDLTATAGRGEVLALARAAETDDPELADRLRRVSQLEALVAPAVEFFEFVLSRNAQKPEAIAKEVREAWGSGLPNLEQEAFQALLPEIQESTGPEIATEYDSLRAALEAGDYRAAIDAVLRWNKLVATARGSAPWARIEQGQLDVRYRGEGGAFPKHADLDTLWQNPYFIGSLKAITRQLEPRQGSTA